MIMQLIFGAVIYATPAAPEPETPDLLFLSKEGLPGKEILVPDNDDEDADVTLILQMVRERVALVQREKIKREKPAFKPVKTVLPRSKAVAAGFNRRGIRKH